MQIDASQHPSTVERKQLRDPINNLRAFRFLFAIFILYNHVNLEVNSQEKILKDFTADYNVVSWIGRGDLFFVISGFLMLYISHDKFGRFSSVRYFLLSRMLRILPFYWFFTTLMLSAIFLLPQYIAHPGLDFTHIVASYLLISHPNPEGMYYPVLMAGWTLNLEAVFYVVFAIGLLLPFRFGIGLIVLVLFMLTLRGVSSSEMSGTNAWASSIYLEFIFGMGVCGLRLAGVRLSSIQAVAVAAFAAGLIVLVGSSGLLAYGNLRGILLGLPAALICMSIALISEQPPKRIKRILMHGGDASFLLYLSHPFIIGLTVVLFDVLGLRQSWLFHVVAMSASVAAALFGYNFVERPILKRLKPS